MRKRTIRIILALGIVALAPAAMAATVSELEQRIQALEDDLLLATEQAADTEARTRREVQVSGYADVEYVAYSGETGKQPGFRLHHFSLFFQKALAERWRFFSEIEYENAPKIEGDHGTPVDFNGEVFVEAVNFDYLWDPRANVRVGRFFTPAGIWSIDHYPPFVPTQDRPQHIRNIFPQLVDGADLYGTLPLGSAFLNYDAYFGNGNGDGTRGDGDPDNTKAGGINVTVSLPALDLLDLGATLYQDDEDTLLGGAERSAAGLHAKLRTGEFSFQTEYATADVSPTAGAVYKREGYYLQFLYDLDSWSFGARHDFYDSNDSIPNNGNEINSLFVNYHVSPTIVLKLEHHMNKPEDSAIAETEKSIASIAVFLGE